MNSVHLVNVTTKIVKIEILPSIKEVGSKSVQSYDPSHMY